MQRGAFIALGIGAALGLAWWRGRNGAELAVELEDLAGMTPRAQQLSLMVLEPNVAAFLAVVRKCESSSDRARAYRMLFGGALFSSFADHPRQVVERLLGGKLLASSAAGAYQILARTWDDVQGALELPDFSPDSQDVAALYLVRRRGALADVRDGRFDDAVEKCAKEWASLPGSPYGQPRKTLAYVRDVYRAAGGVFA